MSLLETMFTKTYKWKPFIGASYFSSAVLFKMWVTSEFQTIY